MTENTPLVQTENRLPAPVIEATIEKTSNASVKIQVQPNQSIESALIENGLIKPEDIAPSAQKKGDVVKFDKPRHSIKAGSRPSNGAHIPSNKRNQGTLHLPQKPGLILPKDETIDPLDVFDASGYTPRMRGWMADPGYDLLVKILMAQRPKGSPRETALLQEVLYTVDGATEDKSGNIVINRGENPHKVLWSCHTDTVHSPREQGTQILQISPHGLLQLHRKQYATCLGADDGTGMWLMLQMLEAGIEGRYVFHYGEEAGCIGSKWISKNRREEVLEGMNYAIAFDRAGTTDVITRQRGSLCASDAFAWSLARQLPGNYTPCPNGVYTDTAEYTSIIPECTNISVGYRGQHGNNETQNLPHLFALRDAMLRIDPSQFVCERDPKAREVSTFRSQIGFRSGNWWDEEEWDAYLEQRYGKDPATEKASSEPQTAKAPKSALEKAGKKAGPVIDLSLKSRNLTEEEYEKELDELFCLDRPATPLDLDETIAKYPSELAQALADIGFTVADVWEEILTRMGFGKPVSKIGDDEIKNKNDGDLDGIDHDARDGDEDDDEDDFIVLG